MIEVLKYWNRCPESGESASLEVLGAGLHGGVELDGLQGSFQHT